MVYVWQKKVLVTGLMPEEYGYLYILLTEVNRDRDGYGGTDEEPM